MEFFWGDERAIAPDDPDSNFGMANAALLAKLHIPRVHIHRMPAERADRDPAAREYQGKIARVPGVAPTSQPPQFDLVLLGMGKDARTASLFPHSAALRKSTRWVVPNDAPGLAAPRLTLTPVAINRVAVVMFLVAGAGPLKWGCQRPTVPRYFLRDRDGIYGDYSQRWVDGMDIREAPIA